MTGKKSKKRHCIIILLSIVILAFVYYIGSRKDGVNVVVAKADITAGTQIDEYNVDDLFEIRCLDAGAVPEHFIKDKAGLAGTYLQIGVDDNTVMQKGFVKNPEKDIMQMQEPVIMGLKALDMSQMVCGTVRKNDIIDLSVINSQNNECMDVVRNVRVLECYNSDGSMITDEGCATYITVIVEKNDEQYINEMLSLGELRICKAGGTSE